MDGACPVWMQLENSKKITHPFALDVLKNGFRPHGYIDNISIHPWGPKVKGNGDFLPILSLDKDIKYRTRMYAYDKKNIQV